LSDISYANNKACGVGLPISQLDISASTGVAPKGKDVPVTQFLEPVEPEYWAEIKAVNERISRVQLGRSG